MVSKTIKSPRKSAVKPKTTTSPVKTVSVLTETPSAAQAPIITVRRKEFVERVALSSGLKPNQIKSVMDAIFRELGDALSKEEVLNIPPLGKIRVNRRKEIENAEILICKLRRNKAPVKVEFAPEDTEY